MGGIARNDIPLAGRGPAHGVVSRLIDVHTVAIAQGGGARRIQADQISLHRIEIAGKVDAIVRIARNQVARTCRSSADKDSRGSSAHVNTGVDIGHSHSAGYIDSDIVPLDDRARRGCADHVHPVLAVARDHITAAGRAAANRGVGSAIHIDTACIADRCGSRGVEPNQVARDCIVGTAQIHAGCRIAGQDVHSCGSCTADKVVIRAVGNQHPVTVRRAAGPGCGDADKVARNQVVVAIVDFNASVAKPVDGQPADRAAVRPGEQAQTALVPALVPFSSICKTALLPAEAVFTLEPDCV